MIRINGQLLPSFKLPVRYEGLFVSRHPGRPPQQRGPNVLSDEVEKRITVTWLPAAGGSMRKELRQIAGTSIAWTGIGPPNQFINPLDVHPTVYPKFSFSSEEWRGAIRWSVSHSNARCDYSHSNPTHVTVYIQPTGEEAFSTIKGTIARRQRGGSHGLLEWYTTWGLHRMGEPPEPDPRTPLPSWDRSLGSPPSLGRPN